ncbi:MAG: ergothioneine biosynthesis protein EgtB [Pseudomonadota bacterium]
MSQFEITALTDGTQENLLQAYSTVRNQTELICEALAIEDYVVQPTPEVSPPKWHLGHSTWFFEEMLLARFVTGYERYHQNFALIFNSYYKAAGNHWIQAERGQLSRPTVDELLHYRHSIDEHVIKLISSDHPDLAEIQRIIELGLHHEQQHQELLYMDIKYILGINPTCPTLSKQELTVVSKPSTDWHELKEGLIEIGNDGNGFSYDNERPRHKSYLYPCSIRESLITNAEYLDFIEAGGYEKAQYWLSKGYDFIRENKINAPLYWLKEDNQWFEYTLHGLMPLNLDMPVCHISYFEAHAFANWQDCRLPTEQEYECFQTSIKQKPFNEQHIFHPVDANSVAALWGWTSSHYSAYPGYQSFDGALQEYNSKFMCNQFVLRGGCVVSPAGHTRPTYRNFYEPHQRWMFSGVRLARDES